MSRIRIALALLSALLCGCGGSDAAAPSGPDGSGSAAPATPPVELSRDKAARVAALSKRLEEQQRTIWDLPDNARLLRADKELDTFCTASDLVAVTWMSDPALSQAAFGLLGGSRAAELSARDATHLRKHLDEAGTPQAWRAHWACQALIANAAHGVPALIDTLNQDPRPFARVHAAGALASDAAKTAVAPEVRRRAVETLLEALGSADAAMSATAHNGLPSLEPWMVDRLLDRLAGPDAPESLWRNGLSRLSGGDHGGHEKPLRQVCERGLRHASAAVRAGAVDLLRSLKPGEADPDLCVQVQKDPDRIVRHRLYLALREAPAGWTTPLLVAGLDDEFAENVGICASALAERKDPACIPRLVDVLRRSRPIQSHDDAGLLAARAIVALAGLQGYDFERHTRSVGNRHIRAHVIENRSDHYQQEAARLLDWWEREGRARFGEGGK